MNFNIFMTLKKTHLTTSLVGKRRNSIFYELTVVRKNQAIKFESTLIIMGDNGSRALKV